MGLEVRDRGLDHIRRGIRPGIRHQRQGFRAILDVGLGGGLDIRETSPPAHGSQAREKMGTVPQAFAECL